MLSNDEGAGTPGGAPRWPGHSHPEPPSRSLRQLPRLKLPEAPTGTWAAPARVAVSPPSRPAWSGGGLARQGDHVPFSMETGSTGPRSRTSKYPLPSRMWRISVQVEVLLKEHLDPEGGGLCELAAPGEVDGTTPSPRGPPGPPREICRRGHRQGRSGVCI